MDKKVVSVIECYVRKTNVVKKDLKTCL